MSARRPRQPRNLLDDARGPIAAETEERIAEFERLEAPAVDPSADLLNHCLRIAEPRGVVQCQVGAVIALEAAAAAGLDQARGEPPEIVADAESRGTHQGPIRQRQAVEVRDHAQLDFGRRMFDHFLQPPEQLLGLALHDRHIQILELLRQHAGRRADDEHAGLRFLGE